MATYTDQLVVYSSGSIKKIAAADVLVFGDSTQLALGAGSDLKLYHDGTDSYITNATGGLKIATETSGIAITIGHSTSEVTIADNLTVSGDLTVSGATTTVSTTNTVVSDKLLELGNGTTGSPSGDAGIVIERGDSDNAIIAWDETNDQFVLGTTTATGASSGTLTITSGRLSINTLVLDGTAVTSTAAELNILDGVTATASELNILDGVTATASEINLLDGDTAVGSSITIADGDGLLINDAGTMKSIPASDLKNYINASAAGSIAADDIVSGDAAVEITTTSGDVVVDAPSGQSVDLQVAGSNVVEVAGARVDVSQPLILASNAGVSLTASSGATIAVGNILSLDSNAKLVLSDADSGTEQIKELIGVALEASTTTEQSIMIHSIHGAKVNVKTDGSACVAGKAVYLDTTAGQATPVAPTSGYVYRLGIALETTSIETDVDILWMPQFVADLG